jgi:hypothetical protein
MAALTAAVAAGEVTPAEAVEVSKLVQDYVKTLEASDFDQRLRVIEGRNGVRGDLEGRLRAVEDAGSGGIEIWTSQGDGTVRGPRGERMTREEAEARGRATGTNQFFLNEIMSRL